MKKYCVGESYTIKEVLEHFEQNHDRVAIVTNDDNKVIGVVSQGDIIKAMSEGDSLYANITTIMNTSFLYMKEKDIAKAYEIFKEKAITMIPIVDNDFYLTDVIVSKDIYEYTDSFIKGSQK